MATAGKVVTNLLTGFLGSGKTSLLKRLLALPELAGTAVLINEFGEVGIDHMLIEEVDEDVVLLQSGCLCCTIRGDLKEAMVRLHGRVAKGEIPAFDRLVIETTGLADPAPIVATLTADPVLRYHFSLGNVITVVDAVDGAHNLDTYPEAGKQVAVADRLVVSKTDLAERPAIDALKARLARLNPTALLLESDEEAAAPALLLLEDVHNEATRRAEVERWLKAEARDDHAEEQHHDPSRHDEHIRSVCLTEERPLDWAAFGLWLSMLLNRHGADVLRVKGILNIGGIATPVAVHGVQHTIHKPVHLDRWPDDDRRTRLVMIVRDLDPKTVERSFNAFNRLAQPVSA